MTISDGVVSGKMAFVQDNARDRAQRSARMKVLKDMGFTIVPARDFDLSLERCQRKNFDLVVIHEGQSLARAIEVCEQILATKPEQKLLLLSPAKVEKPYACADDAKAIEARVRQMFQSARPEPVAA
jgi:hypothetical protein